MEHQLTAEVREETGSGPSGRYRKEELIPAVLYGREVEPKNLLLDVHEISELLREGARGNVLVDLQLASDDEKRQVLIKDADLDPVTSELLHVDLHQVSPEDRVQVKVPVKLTGESPGVEQEDGILDKPIRTLRIDCQASEIPPQIEVSIAEMEIGDKIFVEDIEVAAGVDILTDPQRVVVSVQPPEEFDLEVTPAAGVGLIEETVEEALEEAEEVEGEEVEAEEGEEVESAEGEAEADEDETG